MLPLGREIALTTSLKTSTLCWYSRLSFKNFTSPPNPASSYIQHNGKNKKKVCLTMVLRTRQSKLLKAFNGCDFGKEL